MRRLLLVLPLALTACDTPCPRLALPQLAACVAPDAGFDGDGRFEEADLQLSLTGVDVLDAAPATDCFPTGHAIGAFEPTVETVWLRGTDGAGDGWTIGLAAPGLSAQGLINSTEIDVSWSFRLGGFSPDVGAVEVRDDAGLAVWIGEGADLDTLATPAELLLEEGARVCHQSEDCGSWEWLDLEATWGGRTDTLNHGSSLTFGEHEILHGGYQNQTSASDRCADWFAADIQVAAIRR